MSNFSHRAGDIEMHAAGHRDGSITVTARNATTGEPVPRDRMEAYVGHGDDGSFVVTVKPKAEANG